MSKYYVKNLRISCFLSLIYISILKILISYLEQGNITNKFFTVLGTQILFCICTVLLLYIYTPNYSYKVIVTISVFYFVTYVIAEVFDILFYIYYFFHYFLGIYITISILKLGFIFGYFGFQAFYYLEIQYS